MFFAGKFILDIAGFVESQGMSRLKIMEMAGFDEEILEKENVLVDYDCISGIFKLIKNELKDPRFGLHMGEQIMLSATSYIDQLMDSCSTVQEAFEHAITYSRLISDSMDCSLEMFDDNFRVNFELNPDWSLCDDYAIIQNLDLALICAKNSLYRLTSKEYFPVELNFFYPKPRKTAEHYRLFNTHLKFNTPVSSIVFNRHILHKSTVNHNHGLLEQLKDEANKILGSLPAENQLITRVKKSILKHITRGSSHISDVAGDLYMTTRMLQRRLKAEGLTFKQIQNDIRFQIVRKMKHHGDCNLDEIAYLIGYAESSSFARAFKSWTGSSPGKYFNTSTLQTGKK